ncbi:MAG TPA: methylmalonyl-CoA mutase small subunit [Candidatus Barnesiella excrementipullorum]|uniref:Methylmalonyl-CoA mutase small subunit n=1 Tax=Candidatus Barnesiella excrementipullorum TaxID=2838479 RepID=A0A9D2AP92_9BACT|nr:methylmalonyl-CoA mutase small subunit [Candidatus Barnesiella excrementipullorum]
MAVSKEKLFDQFPPVSTQEWKEKAIADLKGADFDKKLVWRTSEGFNVQPMYREEDIENLKTLNSLPGEYPFVRGTRTNNEWLTRQDIDVTDMKEANAKALDILDKGVDALGFHLQSEQITPEGIKALLDGIHADCIEINFLTCIRNAANLATLLTEYYTQKGYDLAQLRGSINFDPYKRILKKGKDVTDMAERAREVMQAAAQLKNYRIFAVDALLINNAGGHITQELGYALAWGNEWMAMLTDAGYTPDEAASRIKFNFGISSNYFMEIAKFRAARMLWAQIVKQYNPADTNSCKMMAHATTSEFNQTLYDSYVNLLRTQTETMSAALGGVDSITTLPFDKVYATPDDFSERIARNQQLLLKEESHLDKITDPGAGSYYIENLTVSIAEQAWKIFLDIEERGGFHAALQAGYVQEQVNAVSAERHTNVARRKEILLGSNQYPNLNDKALDKATCKEEAHHCGCQGNCSAPTLPTLDFKRASSEFEALRLATEKASHQPVVFMLTIGNLAMRLARSQFATNFFGCAGYKIIDNLGFDTVEAGIDAALEAKADIVVLCSSDDEYATLAPEAFKYLNGRALFVVAGAPACTEELNAIGITEFIHVRSNVLDTLKSFNAKLSI